MLLSSLVLAMGFLASCDEDDDAKSGQVELLSFGPSGVKHGDQITFIGNNLNKVTAIDLPGVSVSSSQFVKQTSEEIWLVVPIEAEEGHVTLKTPEGDIVSKTVLSFEVPVTILTIPAEAKPGTNITITGTFLNWVTEVWFTDGVVVTEFVSQTIDELVVMVPFEAKTGPLILNTGGTEPLSIETEEDLIVTLPTVTTLNPNPVARGAALSIMGTNLDLVAGILFKGITEPVTDFILVSTTELSVVVPESANKGIITLVTYSNVLVASPDALNIVGDLPALAPLGYAFYIDAIENGWGNWGWGGPVDFANTENVRDGQKAIKKTYDGSWDALRFGGGSVSTASYTEITFSIYGTPGTGGLNLSVIPNEQWGSPYVITIVEGEWTEYKLTKANLGNPATLTDFLFQAQGWSGVIYVDHVGLR